jgi:hypothetical protein
MSKNTKSQVSENIFLAEGNCYLYEKGKKLEKCMRSSKNQLKFKEDNNP